jgi:peptidyl-prolyl cis-trans isomerase B (cyclophilin B)
MLHSLLKTTSSALVLSVFATTLAFGADTKASASAKGTASPPDEVAVLETTKGKMVVEFWTKEAPRTVANFKKLAREGFYDGTGFHRIIKDFMIQGGDPKSKNPKAPDLGTGDPGYKIDAEFNSRKHVKGVISMARSADPNSAGSQFFIMHGTAPSLDNQYTGFGRLIEGMDVLDDIANSPVVANAQGEPSKPAEWTTLKSVKIVPRASLAKAKGSSAGKSAAAAGAGTAEAKKAEAAQKAENAGAVSQEKKAADAGTSQEAAPPAASSEPAKPDSAQTGGGSHEGHGH